MNEEPIALPSFLRACPTIECLEDRTVPSTGIGVFNPSTDQFVLRSTPTAGADAGTFTFGTKGDGLLLGNLVYNIANLLNPGTTTELLLLTVQLAALGL